MTIEIYMTPLSAPVRSVLMTAKALNINLDLKKIDLMKREQKTPEFLKLNPQHTVPVINDDGIIIWDSHAINAYLVSKYAKNDSLYPKDLVKRAIVDQRLHFDSGVLFARGMRALRTLSFETKKKLEQTHIDSLNETYEFLEKFLEGRKWIAGDSVTIADYNIYTTLSTVNILVPIDTKKFPKLIEWYKRVDGLPESEVTKEGRRMSVEFLDKLLEK